MRAALLVALALTTACGTTTIRAHGARDAKIFVNGTYAGRGEATIQRRGGSESSTIRVEAADGRTGQTTISRSFTGKTLFLAIITYGICAFACKDYPEDVEVRLDQAPTGPAAGSGWGDAPGALDPWLQAPPGWQPTTPASQPVTPPPTAAPAPNSW